MSHPVGPETLKRVRDYVVDEPGFTCTFAAWDLSRQGPPITATTVRNATIELLRLGIVELIEGSGRLGKVYAYKTITDEQPRRRDVPKPRALFGELDDARVGELAPARGKIVPHTRTEGPSGKPGRDRARSKSGVRVKRQRMGT